MRRVSILSSGFMGIYRVVAYMGRFREKSGAMACRENEDYDGNDFA